MTEATRLDELRIVCMTLCKHCHKAIGLLNLPGVGWLHFAAHDGHPALPPWRSDLDSQ